MIILDQFFCETVQGPEKRPSQGPKNDRNDPEKNPSPRHTYSKHILQKNCSKMIICGLSSGQTILYHITGRTPDLQCIFGNHLKPGLSRPGGPIVRPQVCISNTNTPSL